MPQIDFLLRNTSIGSSTPQYCNENALMQACEKIGKTCKARNIDCGDSKFNFLKYCNF